MKSCHTHVDVFVQSIQGGVDITLINEALQNGLTSPVLHFLASADNDAEDVDYEEIYLIRDRWFAPFHFLNYRHHLVTAVVAQGTNQQIASIAELQTLFLWKIKDI